MNKSIEKKLLMFRIEVKRIIMYKKAELLGTTHPSVVRSSQRLDSLLNRVQGIYS